MGQRLRAVREKKRVSPSQAALKTHIKVQHLEAMERDDFSKMPAPIYARGFIKAYAEYLGLNAAPLIQEYNERHEGGKRLPAPVSAKIIKRVPGDEPLPTATSPGDEPASAAGAAGSRANPSGGVPHFVTPRTLAIAGAAIAAMLLIVAAVKFWPAAEQPERQGRASHVVEVQRPLARSSLAVTRDPPEPYIEANAAGARSP